MMYFADVIDAFLFPIHVMEKVTEKVKIFAYVGTIGLVLGFLQAYVLVMVADRQVRRIRLLYYKVRIFYHYCCLGLKQR